VDENEPIADVLRDVLDLIDQLAARITDDEIEERLHRLLTPDRCENAKPAG
jgi:hypothetical protein